MYFSKNTTNKPFIVSVKLQVTKICRVQDEAILVIKLMALVYSFQKLCHLW